MALRRPDDGPKIDDTDYRVDVVEVYDQGMQLERWTCSMRSASSRRIVDEAGEGVGAFGHRSEGNPVLLKPLTHCRMFIVWGSQT